MIPTISSKEVGLLEPSPKPEIDIDTQKLRRKRSGSFGSSLSREHLRLGFFSVYNRRNTFSVHEPRTIKSKLCPMYVRLYCIHLVTLIEFDHWSSSPSSQYQALPKDKLFPNAVAGATFTTIDINTPQYLLYLFSRFQAAGGKVVRATLQSIDQVIKPDAPDYSSPADLSVGTGPKPARVDAAIVCLGLGARKLAGVDDASLYPIRGQTVILRAPWMRSGISLSGEEGAFSYVIPRGNGEVRA